MPLVPLSPPLAFSRLYIIFAVFIFVIILLFSFIHEGGTHFILLLVEMIEDTTCCLETLIWEENEWGVGGWDEVGMLVVR